MIIWTDFVLFLEFGLEMLRFWPILRTQAANRVLNMFLLHPYVSTSRAQKSRGLAQLLLPGI